MDGCILSATLHNLLKGVGRVGKRELFSKVILSESSCPSQTAGWPPSRTLIRILTQSSGNLPGSVSYHSGSIPTRIASFDRKCTDYYWIVCLQVSSRTSPRREISGGNINSNGSMKQCQYDSARRLLWLRFAENRFYLTRLHKRTVIPYLNPGSKSWTKVDPLNLLWYTRFPWSKGLTSLENTVTISNTKQVRANAQHDTQIVTKTTCHFGSAVFWLDNWREPIRRFSFRSVPIRKRKRTEKIDWNCSRILSVRIRSSLNYEL